MAIYKKLSKIEKRKILGALLIMSFVALCSIIFSNYVIQTELDILKITIAMLMVGGFIAIYIELRGTLGKRATKIRAKIKRKKKKREKKKR